MLARHARDRTSTLLFDFLAPSLVSHRSITSTSTSGPAEPPRSPPKPESKAFKNTKKVPPLVKHFTRKPATHPSPVPTTESISASQLRFRDSLFNDVLRQIHILDTEERSPELALHRRLTTFQKSIDAKGVKSATNAWAEMEDANQIELLTPAELRDCSRRISQLFTDAASVKIWTRCAEAERTALINISLYLAGLRYTDALLACFSMQARLRQDQAILYVYERFLSVWKETNSLAKEGDDVEDLGFEDKPDSEFITSTAMAEARTPPRGSQIVSFAILAHLFRNDFQGAIALSLKAPFRINLHTVDPLIRSLDLPEDLAMEARIFLTHCNAASLVRAHHSFSHHVYNVLSRMKLGALRTLYSTMVIGLGDEYPWLTIDPAKVSPQRPLVFSEYYWAMFVKSFLTLRRRDVVKVMWDDMIGHGHRPGVHIWTTLIRGIGETEGPDEALAVWRAMRDAGVQPDSVAYQAVVAALLRGRRVAEAANLFNEFRRARAKLPNTLSDDPVYNTMLSGYLANNRPGEAHALLEEMKTLGPAPSAITFNTFMGYYLSFHDFKAISAILKDVSARGLADVVTFSILLRSLLHIVPTAEALEKTLTLMAKHSFQPNAISLTSIVSHLCQEKTVDALKAALELVRTMEESGNPSMLPNAVTYTSVLTAVHKWPDLDRRLVEDTTAHIVRKMEERHIAFTKVTYNILISVFLGYQEPEGLRQGMQYYREMMKTGTVLTADTWYIVLRGLRERGEWGIASEVVDDMVQSDATIPEWLGALASDIRREADRRRSSRWLCGHVCDALASDRSPRTNDLLNPKRT